jgi:spermidine synthase
MLVLMLFFCSGATALVYEVLWSKYLSLMLGSTVQAQTVVLSVFMGGLALGNRIFGNKADALRKPLSFYGYLEIAIGLYAFFFFQIYTFADFLFAKIGTPIFEQSGLLLALKLLISFSLLIGPTILMGGTLPLLASWIQKQPNLDWSSRVSLFYGINSLGAVAGAGLAGFVLVQNLGMVSSLQVVALGNVLIGFIAIVLSKRELAQTIAQPELVSAEPSPAHSGWKWLGLLVAVTGGVSMGLEVLSSRALALIVGGSLQAFSLVLMSFIFGIGIGSIFISSSKLARRLGLYTIYILLATAAILVGLNVIFIEKWAIVYSQAKFALAPNATGYFWHQALIACMGFLVLGIPAAFLGATVPLSITLLEKSGATAAVYVGRLLTWNTVGAVAGVLVTGFTLMPLFGLRGALTALSLFLLAVVAVISLKQRHHRILIPTLAITAALSCGIFMTGQDWRHVLGAGVFRYRHGPLTAKKIDLLKKQADILFYKDAPDATVAVEEDTLGPDEKQLCLRINGKIDASSIGDLSTQYLVAHLPMMANPDAKQVFLLGFGSGITAGALVGHPIEKLTIAENCNPVLEAAPLFKEWNRNVIANSKAIVRKEDARTVLKLSPQKYDVLICEPSNPWVVGVGSVFSKDFYELASSRLSDGGIMAQWFHIYEMSDDIVYLVVRTFGSVFPNMEIWDTENGDIVLLGSKTPWSSNPAQFQKIYERPEPKADLQRINMSTPLALWVRQIASQRTAFAIAGAGPVQSDEFPVLEYAAPRAFFIGSSANRLFAFDERAWQFPLAGHDKIKVMRALPRHKILEAVDIYSSSNSDLQKYFQDIGSNGMATSGSRMQLIFRPPSDYPEALAVPENSSDEYRRLAKIEMQILRQSSDWAQNLDQVEKILEKLTDEKYRSTDCAPYYYAALGARFAIQHQDYTRADRLVKLGLMFQPFGDQLLYLSRILDRVAPPEGLASQGRTAQKETAEKNL